MKTQKIHLLTALLCFGMGLVSCSYAQEAPQEPQAEFRLPEVPEALTRPEDRANYLSLHYWDHFDFADTTLISRPDITEQAYVNFISVLPYAGEAQAAVDTLFHRARADRQMLYHFIALGDKYLYEPNSPMHNEELYLLQLRSLVALPGLDEADKIRPQSRLEMALKNRVGMVAADFKVVRRNGKSLRLSSLKADHILVYFNDPDCTDCIRVKAALAASPIVQQQLADGQIQLLSVCVEGKTEAWEKATLPAHWIDTYDKDQRLTVDQVYDLKALPSLYLLDREQRVVLKDGRVEDIVSVLAAEENGK